MRIAQPSVTSWALAAIFLVAACSSKPDDSEGTASTTANMSADTGMAAGSQSSGMNDMEGMSGMTGDPDHDFLRMMSDHHKGLIAMVHPTIESRENLSVKADARQMDKKQDAELEKMVAMLDKQYKDDYTPKLMPEHKQMADELMTKSGKEYSRTFLQNVIRHHEEAIKMVDDYLPNGKNAEAKSMATKMKSDQTQEIARLKKELART